MPRKTIAAVIAFHLAVLVGTVASSDDKGVREDPESSFPVLSGIGLALSITDAGPQIFKVLPGSVAEKSGRMHKGDRILSIRNGDRTIEEIARAHPEWRDHVVLLTATVDTNLQAASKIVDTRKWKETTHLSLAPEKLEAMNIVVVPAVSILSRDGRIAAAGDPHSISIEKEVSKLLSPSDTDR